MKLPLVPQASLNIQPIDWTGLDRRFLNPGELEVLVALVRSVNAKGVLEIGCNTGRTAKALLDNVPSIERYQGIDVKQGYIPSKAVQRHEVPRDPGHMAMHNPRFELLLSERGSFDLMPDDLLPCDVCFIDGDHGAEAVQHDTDLAHDVVRHGGMIIWHDYHSLATVDVRDVLDALYAGGAPIVHVESTWIAYQKV
jgi:predicted O-methyltransferase YrrM